MTDQGAARAAWGLAALSLGGAALTGALVVVNRRVIHGFEDANPIELIVPVGYGLIGGLVASRRKENPIGWIFLAIGLTAGIAGWARQYALRDLTDGPGSLWGSHVLGWIQNWIAVMIFPCGLLLFFFLLFPDGKLPSRRWRVLALLGVVWTAYALAISMLDPTPVIIQERLPRIANPIPVRALGDIGNNPLGAIAYLGGLLLLVASVAAVVVRFRRARGEDRQRLKAFVFAAVVPVLGLVALLVAYLLGTNPSDIWWTVAIAVGFGVMVPVACGIAILRHGLYEIDVVINKTVVFGALAAFITAVYAGVVIGIGTVVGSKSNTLLTVAAAVVIAVAFQPVRDWARRLANRMVYGTRATPYEVLSEFAERLSGAYSPDDILPRMARIAAEGTGAARVDVWLRLGREIVLIASWPEPDGAERRLALAGEELPAIEGVDRAIPVRHQAELLGALTLKKPRGEALTPTEDNLLGNLASQAGLVLRNAALTADLRTRLDELQASRQRIVAAQDAERRRLERNIHDGAQQQLVAIAVKLRLLEVLIRTEPEKAAQMAGQIGSEANEALEDLRDLARGIYPPLLADKGLQAALGAQIRKAALPVELQTDGVGRFQQEVEAAVYFCILEALQNVSKYAKASRCSVRLSSFQGELVFSVEDDGVGFDPRAVSGGSGLKGMSDRMAALGGELDIRTAPGGGTAITGRLRPEGAELAG